MLNYQRVIAKSLYIIYKWAIFHSSVTVDGCEALHHLGW